MANLEAPKNDPLQVLTSTQFVVENSKSVILEEAGVDGMAQQVDEYLQTHKLREAADDFKVYGDYQAAVQAVFLQDVVNFCFWSPDSNQPRWEMNWMNETRSGAFGMIRSFRRAVSEHFPILDADFLESISLDDVRHLFRSSNGVEIPLINQRLANLQEAGAVLNQKYLGQFFNALELVQYDAVKLVQLVFQDFPSFKDVTRYRDHEVRFLKRAQIVPNDLAFLAERNHQQLISNLDKLTAFADYKLPQVLREAGVIKYSPDLAQRVDSFSLIPKDSKEEVEIRASTVWAGELIRQKIPQYTASQIDTCLWFLGQSLTNPKPYHRTYTIYY